ncbi:MAG: 6-phosphogluconolactonase [Patescibacteria group bacterium]
MKFIFSKDPSLGITEQSGALISLLREGKRVLWLLAGGSNIPIAAEIIAKVRASVSSDTLSHLSLALTDERYGPVGHADSNWFQLQQTGYDLWGITTYPILRDLSLKETIDAYDRDAEKFLHSADVIVAQFGMGADGHIAGLLPRCSALQSSRLVDGYVGAPFTRISLTVPALHLVQIAYAFVFGESKKNALQNLHDKTLSLEEQPAQILKEIPEVYVYQDVM